MEIKGGSLCIPCSSVQIVLRTATVSDATGSVSASSKGEVSKFGFHCQETVSAHPENATFLFLSCR